MIKEKSKKSRFDNKTKTQIINEYLRTIGISLFISIIITVYLSFHAKNAMIKNIYANASEKQRIEEQIAVQLVSQSDLTKDLRTKKYSICMQVGNLYETAHDYKNAQLAYEYAVEKVKPGIYTPYYKLAGVLIAQEKFKEAEDILNSLRDTKNASLIKYKTRSYIEMGDKYYSIGKFLSAAKSYERAKFYYDRFSKKDKDVEKSIIVRIVNAYNETAGIMVKSGLNSDAVRFLQKALTYSPDDFNIKYKLAIIYSDLNPVQSVKYFESLLDKNPQYIDYGVYNKALMKAANIADLEGNSIQAKYYRYKIYSVDLFVNQKVVYKNDIEIIPESFTVKKMFFKYKLRAKYRIKNVSNSDILKLTADFVLRRGDEVRESVTIKCVSGKNPLYSNGDETGTIEVVFGKNIFTKKELEQYAIDIYLYKDDKYKTLVCTMKVPLRTIHTYLPD